MVVAPVVTPIIANLGHLLHVTAFADSFIVGSAGSSTQSNENAATAAVGIVDGAAARAARSLGHLKLVADVPIRSQARAIKPRLVKKFAGLYMKTYRHETRLT